MKIITATISFEESVVFIESITENIENPFHILILYDLGMKQEDLNMLRMKYPLLIIQHFDHSSYSWKSSILYEVSIKFPEHHLIWLEPGMNPDKYFISNIDIFLENNGIFILNQSDMNKRKTIRETHPATLHIMQCQNEYLDHPILSTSCLGFNLRFHYASKLLSDWFHFSQNKICSQPENENLQDNIFSILYYKN